MTVNTLPNTNQMTCHFESITYFQIINFKYIAKDTVDILHKMIINVFVTKFSLSKILYVKMIVLIRILEKCFDLTIVYDCKYLQNITEL